MKVFIFHCWGGSARGCWRGWLADELRKKGIEVVAPNFPNTNTPNLDEWLAEIRKHVPKFDEDWVLVSHSLGGPTVLRLLESFGDDEKVGKIILVAAFANDPGIPEIQSFVDKEFNYEKIKSKANTRIIVNSDDDPFIELSEGERLAKLIDAKLIVEHSAGHMNEGSGHLTFPKILDLILNREPDAENKKMPQA